MINKRLKRFQCFLLSIVIISLSFCLYGTSSFPNPTSLKYANDYVGILTQSETQQIINIGKELEDRTGVQAITVIINSTQPVPIEDYANKLFRSWGIGQSGKDNGLLILVAIQDRSWRVEVGRGLEGAMPDALSNRVMDGLAKPYFAQAEYGKGIVDSYSAFADTIANEYGITLEKSLNVPIPGPTRTHSSSPATWGLLVGALLFIDLIFNRGRMLSFFMQIIFWNNITGRGGRGGGYGGGNGGGFGGFGGGSSNGGGSSGNW